MKFLRTFLHLLKGSESLSNEACIELLVSKGPGRKDSRWGKRNDCPFSPPWQEKCCFRDGCETWRACPEDLFFLCLRRCSSLWGPVSMRWGRKDLRRVGYLGRSPEKNVWTPRKVPPNACFCPLMSHRVTPQGYARITPQRIMW